MLLKQMAEEKTEVRPAVISDSVRLGFDEYRGFSHIVRNVYTYKFDSARIEKLTENAGPLFARLQAELLAFADFLEASDEEDV
jgi:HepT-like protein